MLTEKDWVKAIEWANKNAGKPTMKYEYLKEGNKYMLNPEGERIQIPVMENGQPIFVQDEGEQLIMHFFREKVLDPKELGSLILVKVGKYQYYRIKKVVQLNNGDKKEIKVQDKNLAKTLSLMQNTIQSYQNQVYVGNTSFTPDDDLYNACIKWYTHYAKVKKCKNSTITNFSSKIGILEREELAQYSKMPIKNFTYKDFEALGDLLQRIPRLIVGPNQTRIVGTEPYSESTIALLWWAIKRTYQYLRENFPGYSDIFENVPTPYDPEWKKRFKRYNVFDEISMLIFEKVATATYGNGIPYFKHGEALVFLMYSGLRKGEFAGLTKKDFTRYNDDTGRIIINKQIKNDPEIRYDENGLPITTKNGKPKKFTKMVLSPELKTNGSNRNVALGIEATVIASKKLNKSKTAENDFLFKPFYRTEDSKKQQQFTIDSRLLPEYKELKGKLFLDPQHLNKTLESVLKNCIKHPTFNKYNDFNPETFTVHDLRHTAISHALRKGMAIQDVALWAGHNDLSTTMTYYNQVVQQQKEHAKLLSSATTQETHNNKNVDLVFEINGSVRHYDNKNGLIDPKDFEEMLKGFVELQKDKTYLRGTPGKPANDTANLHSVNNLPLKKTKIMFPAKDDFQNIEYAELNNKNTLTEAFGVGALLRICDNMTKLYKINFTTEEIYKYILSNVDEVDDMKKVLFVDFITNRPDVYKEALNLEYAGIQTTEFTEATKKIYLDDWETNKKRYIVKILKVFVEKANACEDDAEKLLLLKIIDNIEQLKI